MPEGHGQARPYDQFSVKGSPVIIEQKPAPKISTSGNMAMRWYQQRIHGVWPSTSPMNNAPSVALRAMSQASPNVHVALSAVFTLSFIAPCSPQIRASAAPGDNSRRKTAHAGATRRLLRNRLEQTLTMRTRQRRSMRRAKARQQPTRQAACLGRQRLVAAEIVETAAYQRAQRIIHYTDTPRRTHRNLSRKCYHGACDGHPQTLLRQVQCRKTSKEDRLQSIPERQHSRTGKSPTRQMRGENQWLQLCLFPMLTRTARRCDLPILLPLLTWQKTGSGKLSGQPARQRHHVSQPFPD